MKYSIPNIWKESNDTLKYNYFKSIDFLPLLNYINKINTGDLRHLLKLDDYEILPETNTDELITVWENIERECTEVENSNSAIIQYTTAKSVHKMELEYLMLWNIYNMISIAPEHPETIKILEYSKLKLTRVQIEKKLKILRNRIELKRHDAKSTQNDKKVDFYEIIDQIEDIKGRSIDLKNTTVRQFIAIKKNIKKNGKRQDNTKGRT